LDELSSVDNAVVRAIVENLPDVSHREIQKGAERFYDDTACYEKTADVEVRERADQEEYWYQNRFTYQWQDFCEKVQYERRFFRTKELLDKLFGKPSEYEGGAIDPVYMLKAGHKIFRARILDGNFTERVLSLDPSRELGAPPRERAPAGRMNVEYIPAFYGAFSEQTAVAETGLEPHRAAVEQLRQAPDAAALVVLLPTIHEPDATPAGELLI
jgi:RES domain